MNESFVCKAKFRAAAVAPQLRSRDHRIRGVGRFIELRDADDPEHDRFCSIAATEKTQRAMPVREQTPKVSTKLKVVMELRRHLLLSPEEYRLLVAHIVRDHLAAERRAPGRRRERKVA
jgi:hypothetical protein